MQDICNKMLPLFLEYCSKYLKKYLSYFFLLNISIIKYKEYYINNKDNKDIYVINEDILYTEYLDDGTFIYHFNNNIKKKSCWKILNKSLNTLLIHRNTIFTKDWYKIDKILKDKKNYNTLVLYSASRTDTYNCDGWSDLCNFYNKYTILSRITTDYILKLPTKHWIPHDNMNEYRIQYRESWNYIQGAADDEENWSYGLNNILFTYYMDEILSCYKQLECEDIIKNLLNKKLDITKCTWQYINKKLYIDEYSTSVVLDIS